MSNERLNFAARWDEKGDLVTAPLVHADDAGYRALGPERIAESVAWLADHGLDNDTLVFQVEYDVIDCPMFTAWWLTKAEFSALTKQQLWDADYELTALAHKTEHAVRYLPSWWRPDLPERAA